MSPNEWKGLLGLGAAALALALLSARSALLLLGIAGLIAVVTHTGAVNQALQTSARPAGS